MLILEISGLNETPPEPVGGDSLQTGVLSGGCASRPTGSAWYDTSSGESYGDGRRYEHEETLTMTKVPSRTDR